MRIPNPNRPIVDEDGKMTREFREFLILVARNDLLSGTVAPNGNIEGTRRQMYFNRTSGFLYVKGDKTPDTGWEKI